MNNTVEKMGTGGKETFGILAYGNTAATISDNTVSEYERGGIGANGDIGPLPDPDVTVTNNTVTGTGSNGAWGPNGIQIGFGATGKITDNDVADNRYGETFETAISAGILVFASSEVMVRNNRVSNSDIGIASAAAENNKAVQNEVTDAILGVYLAGANNNKLINNSLVNTDEMPPGTVGIANVGTNNKLINKVIRGFAEDVFDAGTDTKVHATKP